MLDVAGHLRNARREVGYEDSEHPLIVNCCGYQMFKTKNFSRKRLHGRVDYQLIYIHKGCGYFSFNNCLTPLSAGHLILYRPQEPQIYEYLAEDLPEIYWIHFTGFSCNELLAQYDIHTCYLGENLTLKSLFQETMLELQLKKPLFEDIIINNFTKILATIQRTRLLQAEPMENEFSIDRLVIQLNQHYNNSWTISSMAEFCNLSPDYFAHSFKKRMKISPGQYLNQLRIEKAKELLYTDTMSVSTIASLVGFDDPLYFSRVFKKYTGYSPKSFHKNMLLLNTPF